MIWILQLLLNAAVLLLAAKLMPSIKMRDFATAIAVAFVIGILNATLGWLMRVMLNILMLPFTILTLGLLSFFIRLFVLAVVIKIADRLFSGFEVASFRSALLLAVIMALAGSVFSIIF